jgi:putative membrane protein
MGLATVAIQTASGNSGAEMTIEGILQADLLRDELYAQMRGAKNQSPDAASSRVPDAPSEAGEDEALSLLHEIRDALNDLVRRSADA